VAADNVLGVVFNNSIASFTVKNRLRIKCTSIVEYELVKVALGLQPIDFVERSVSSLLTLCCSAMGPLVTGSVECACVCYTMSLSNDKF
jgi:hypothetical protein